MDRPIRKLSDQERARVQSAILADRERAKPQPQPKPEPAKEPA